MAKFESPFSFPPPPSKTATAMAVPAIPVAPALLIPPVSQFLGDFQTKGHSDFAVCGVLIEIVGELWGLPCVTIQFFSLFA